MFLRKITHDEVLPNATICLHGCALFSTYVFLQEPYLTGIGLQPPNR